ncbi:glutathione peroxidase [Sneathiella marina]|uniref:Glutathione peroxidase n=1 Tax=Sneathiella marina TaxID=2950108 RepID=A0ABY4W4L3_9PROT|nr:glutathione peroxidase [Sneathiella marina]USG61771.1 glutathione peroxidase [Sneathiella marina]
MLENIEGHQIPTVNFKTRSGDAWKDVTTDDLFAGKKVVLFALPGAFTPTCSSSHLPRYNELVSTFKGCGVDDVICLSVNDTFVMNEWKKTQKAENITFLPDGTGAFTKGMGMLVDKDDLGFGKRSWRYSMIVNDGKIEKMFIEPDVAGDPFEVSDADTMLQYLNPQAIKPKAITVFSKPGCGHCARAKSALRNAGLNFEEIILGTDATSRSLRAVSGELTTPQIFIDGVKIGGADQLDDYLSTNQSAAA